MARDMETKRAWHHIKRARGEREVHTWLTEREQEALEEMCAMTGLSQSDCLRQALYRFAAHLEPNIDTTLFKVRASKKSRRAA